MKIGDHVRVRTAQRELYGKVENVRVDGYVWVRVAINGVSKVLLVAPHQVHRR